MTCPPPPTSISLPSFLQVGDVLVERTVGEVLPAVEQNLEQIEEVRGEGRLKAFFLFFFLSSLFLFFLNLDPL